MWVMVNGVLTDNLSNMCIIMEIFQKGGGLVGSCGARKRHV